MTLASDDVSTSAVERAWHDLAVALVDDLHATASAGLRGIADAAKHGLDQVHEPVAPAGMNGEATTTLRTWSPWLVGAAVGIGLILLPRWSSRGKD